MGYCLGETMEGREMKCCVLGSQNTALCQISDIRAGFSALGHTPIIDYTDPDTSFVFVGNGPYDSYIDLVRSKQRKVIFNVLDCPTWVPEWPELKAKWAEQLPLAAKVTCISKTVQRDLAEFFGVKADVIYYPSKPVRFIGEKKYPQFKVAMIGRLRDPEKFVSTAVQALIQSGFNEREVAIIGPEPIGWGTPLGVLSDNALNDLYNSVDYVLMLDRGAGIGLPAIEAACVGAIPIVARHLATFDEFWVESPLGLQYQMINSVNSIATLLTSIERDSKWKANLKLDMLAYGNQFFYPKFDRKEVAKRIIGVYHSV